MSTNGSRNHHPGSSGVNSMVGRDAVTTSPPQRAAQPSARPTTANIEYVTGDANGAPVPNPSHPTRLAPAASGLQHNRPCRGTRSTDVQVDRSDLHNPTERVQGTQHDTADRRRAFDDLYAGTGVHVNIPLAPHQYPPIIMYPGGYGLATRRVNNTQANAPSPFFSQAHQYAEPQPTRPDHGNDGSARAPQYQYADGRTEPSGHDRCDPRRQPPVVHQARTPYQAYRHQD